MAGRAPVAHSNKDTDLLARDVTKQLGAKLADAYFLNKIKEVEAKAESDREAAHKAHHDKARNEILIKRLQRELEDSQEHCRKLEEDMHAIETIATAKATSLRKSEGEVERLSNRVTELQTTLETSSEVVKLMADVKARNAQIELLTSELNQVRIESNEKLSQLTLSYESLEKASDDLYKTARAKHRWQLAGTLVILNDKRRFERKAKARAALLSWLSGQEEADHATTIQGMNMELEYARGELKAATNEQEALREAAAKIAQSKATLEAQQAELVRTAKEAVGRDDQLEKFARTSEERAAAASERVRALTEENQYLRWAASQADERIREAAAESAGLVGERDAAIAQLHERKRAIKEAHAELETVKGRLLKVEAATFAERAQWMTRVSESERAAREGANLIHRLRQLEGELSTASKHAASEGLAHDKQKVLVSRLMELESTFGAMLTPAAAGASPYTHALQALANSPSKGSDHSPSARTSHHSPVLVTQAGSAAHGAAMAAAASAYASALQPKGSLSPPVGALQKAARPMPLSTSLPLLTQGVRSPVPVLSHKPVARGAARVAARRGVPVGTRSEVQQALEKVQAAKARSQMGPDHSVTHVRY